MFGGGDHAFSLELNRQTLRIRYEKILDQKRLGVDTRRAGIQDVSHPKN